MKEGNAKARKRKLKLELTKLENDLRLKKITLDYFLNELRIIVNELIRLDPVYTDVKLEELAQLKIARKSNAQKIKFCYLLQTLCYSKMNLDKYDEAEKYTFKFKSVLDSLKIDPKEDSKNHAEIQILQGLCHVRFFQIYYFDRKDYKKALASINTAIKFSKKNPGHFYTIKFLTSRSKLYTSQKKLQLAIKDLFTAFKLLNEDEDIIRKSADFDYEVACLYEMLAENYYQSGLFEIAKQNASMADNLFKNDRFHKSDYYQLMFDVAFMQSDFKSSLNYALLFFKHNKKFKYEFGTSYEECLIYLSLAYCYVNDELNTRKYLKVLNKKKLKNKSESWIDLINAKLAFQKKDWVGVIKILQNVKRDIDLKKGSYVYEQKLKLLYQAHKNLKNYKEVIKFAELLLKIDDNNKSKKQQRAIIKYDYEYKLQIEAEENLRAIKEKEEKEKTNLIIEQKNIALDEANQTKDYLFSIIAHDLRKPAIAFRGISKKVAYLLENQDYKRLRQLGQSIEKDANALNLLTDNLLNWALSQKDAIRYNPSQFYLNEISEDLLSIFFGAAKRKKINLINKIDSNLEIYTDKNLLQTCLRNLIDNAIKFCKANDNILLNAKRLKKGLSISIKDTGIGMSQKFLDNLFAIKNNKSQDGTTGEKGTGLGLNLVYDLVDVLNGRIEVKSKIGKGTTI